MRSSDYSEAWSSLYGPKKLVPESKRKCTFGPRKAKKAVAARAMWIAHGRQACKEHCPAFAVSDSTLCASGTN